MFIWNKNVLAAGLTETVSTLIQGYTWHNNTVSRCPKSWCVHVCQQSWRENDKLKLETENQQYLGDSKHDWTCWKNDFYKPLFWGQQKPVLRLKNGAVQTNISTFLFLSFTSCMTTCSILPFFHPPKIQIAPSHELLHNSFWASQWTELQVLCYLSQDRLEPAR